MINSSIRSGIRVTPGVALVVLAVIIPFVGLFIEAVHDADFVGVWSRPGVVPAVWFSVWMGAVSTLATLTIGLPASWITSRFRFVGRRLARVVLGIPFVLPTVVVGAAFLAISPGGRGTITIVAAHAFFNVSVILRTTSPVFASLDGEMLDAARTLGAGRLAVIRDVVWPISRSAVLAASGLVFVLSATSYGIVRILGDTNRSTIDVEIYRRAIDYGDTSGAAVLALAQAVVMLVVVTWSGSRRTFELREIETREPRRPGRMAILFIWITTLAFVVPIGALITRSFHGAGGWTASGWQALLGIGRPSLDGVEVADALFNSLRFAILTALLVIPIGVALARSSSRSRLVRMIASTPIAVSAVMVGLGILVTYDHDPFDLRASWWLIPVVHASVALPYVIRSIGPLLDSIPRGLDEAAATLGAAPWRAWWSVEVPLLRPALVTATATSLAISLGEFGATSLLTRRESRTLPLLVESLLGRSGGIGVTAGSAAATLLLVVTGSIVLTLDKGLRS